MQPSIDYDAPYPASPAPPPDILGHRAKSIQRKNVIDLQGFLAAREKRDSFRQIAARLLWDSSGTPIQKYRVTHCGRSISGDGVDILRAPDGSKARFVGLTTCGSGWMCPVCSRQIAEGRRAEASAAMVQHCKGGGIAQLLTLTFSHYADEPLASMLEKFDKARQSFKNCVTYKKILGKKGGAGCIGAITALEVTYSKMNGWHPHVHMILFSRRNVLPDEHDRLRAEWVRILLKSGLSSRAQLNDLLDRAFDLRDGQNAAEYITKYDREESWGFSSELTRAHSKEWDDRGHYKPFGLLELVKAGREWAGDVFVEFAEAFHGKRLLTWSPGLKAAFELQDVKDAQLAEIKALPKDEFVGRLTPAQWKIVMDRGARHDVLRYAAACCSGRSQDDLDDFIRYLERKPKTRRGWFVQKSDGCVPDVYH